MHAVEALLAAGADATIGEGDGYTPMHGAGFQGRGEVAKLLIVHGLDPSDVHSDGYTPLHRSCWGGEQRHTEMARVLLEAGVPHDQKATDGKKPIEMVRKNTPNPNPDPNPNPYPDPDPNPIPNPARCATTRVRPSCSSSGRRGAASATSSRGGAWSASS